MKKKVLITTLSLIVVLTLVIVAIWQYHKNTPEQKLLNMYNNNQSITIELAEPISQEQGTEVHVEWTELAALNNYEVFRMTVDDALGITAQGENGKNGVIYVDLQGNHTNNSTLFNAFANQKFRDNVWNNSDVSQVIIGAAQSIYTDVESDKAALLAGYNAYYNLLNDSEPGYANMYSTITRLEAMAMIFKADTPVYEIEVNEQFASAVENEELAPYAQELNDYSFLKADNLSLDGNTANGTITRAEFVYMIVQRYFAGDYANITGKESCYSDAKNGGDVATEIGLITTDKETGATTVKNRCESYELSYCIQVEKAGMPEELYRAMVVAQQRGLITGSECRWSDGLIKGEALTILTNAYNSMETQTNADRGAASGEVVVAIDFKDIDPAIHATYNAETGEITVDDTMVNTLMEKSAFFDNRSAANMRKILPIYLKGYFTGRYDGNAWYQFVLTGDTSYLNFEISDAELILRAEQEAEEYVNSEEFKNSDEYSDYQQAQDELAKLKEELEALKNGSTGSGNGSGSTGGGSGNSGNTGGGSAPEMPSGGNGSDNSDPWAGDGSFELGDLGDGGDIITDIGLNP